MFLKRLKAFIHICLSLVIFFLTQRHIHRPYLLLFSPPLPYFYTFDFSFVIQKANLRDFVYWKRFFFNVGNISWRLFLDSPLFDSRKKKPIVNHLFNYLKVLNRRSEQLFLTHYFYSFFSLVPGFLEYFSSHRKNCFLGGIENFLEIFFQDFFLFFYFARFRLNLIEKAILTLSFLLLLLLFRFLFIFYFF